MNEITQVKFDIEIDPVSMNVKTTIYVKIGYKILDIQNVRGNFVMWYSAPVDADSYSQTFTFATSDVKLSPASQHLKTLQVFEGRMILHVFKE